MTHRLLPNGSVGAVFRGIVVSPWCDEHSGARWGSEHPSLPASCRMGARCRSASTLVADPGRLRWMRPARLPTVWAVRACGAQRRSQAPDARRSRGGQRDGLRRARRRGHALAQSRGSDRPRSPVRGCPARGDGEDGYRARGIGACYSCSCGHPGCDPIVVSRVSPPRLQRGRAHRQAGWAPLPTRSPQRRLRRRSTGTRPGGAGTQYAGDVHRALGAFAARRPHR